MSATQLSDVHDSVWAAIARQDPRTAAGLARTSRRGREVGGPVAARAAAAALELGSTWRRKTDERRVMRLMRETAIVMRTPPRHQVAGRLGFGNSWPFPFFIKREGRWLAFVGSDGTSGAIMHVGPGGGAALLEFTNATPPAPADPAGPAFPARMLPVVTRAWHLLFRPQDAPAVPRSRYDARIDAAALAATDRERAALARPPVKRPR